MPVILYTFFLFLYRVAIGIASLWNHKAKQWINGRKNIFEHLVSWLPTQNSELRTPNSELLTQHSALPAQHSPIIWFHCSSLGEFEQGRPVMERIKVAYPGYKLLLTFFSPSGYEIRKDYPVADRVMYLPMDSQAHANKFLDLVNPSLVVFIKYDYWYFYLRECKKRKIPLLMVSALFRSDQPFFSWYGSLHRKMLHCFTHFFVQDENSKNLLKSISVGNVTVAGDTRFDRVIEIAEKFKPIPGIEMFCGKSTILVAGSTWPGDERIIKEAVASVPGLRLIIAPHEIHPTHLEEVRKFFPGCIFYSTFKKTGQLPDGPGVLVMDNIGVLSSLYHYASIAYVGGGFNAGIHNILEAVVFCKPVIFGPRYQKTREAIALREKKAAFPVSNSAELLNCIENLMEDRNGCYKMAGQQAAEYMSANKGATEKIFRFIQENRLLTS